MIRLVVSVWFYLKGGFGIVIVIWLILMDSILRGNMKVWWMVLIGKYGVVINIFYRLLL